MTEQPFPILEFDPDPEALISPQEWAERGWRGQREVRRALVDLCLETIAAL